MEKKPTYEDLQKKVKELEQEAEKRKQTEEALRESEDQMGAILNATTETMLLIDNQGFAIAANQIACERMEIKRENLIGHCIYDFFPPEVTEKRRRKYNSVFDTGKPVSFTDSRKGRIFEQNVYPVFGDKGRIEKVAVFAGDITERKRAEEKLIRMAQEWKTTFDATNDAIWILDQDQRIQRTNEKAEQLFQHPASELIGKHCYKIVHGTEQPIPECPNLRARHSLCRETMELEIGESWFQVTLDPILDTNGRYAGAVHIISDITKRKRAEEALRESKERLKRHLETIDSMGIGIFIVNRDYHIRHMNKTMIKWFGDQTEMGSDLRLTHVR